MKRQLAILLGVSGAIALILSVSRGSQESLDLISPGMRRAQVDSVHGKPIGPVAMYEDGDSTYLDFGDARPPEAIGNHPETTRDDMPKVMLPLETTLMITRRSVVTGNSLD